MNGTMKLLEAGQSIWYDNIQRKLLRDGEMARMIGDGEIRFSNASGELLASVEKRRLAA